MSTRHALPLVLAGLMAGAAGCITVGGPFNSAQVPALSIGKTTKDDVTKTFGQPFRTGTEDGDETWTYVDYHFRLLGPQQAKDLFIRFNKDGTVKSYSFNTTE